MLNVVADSACRVVLMHMQGTPQTMQTRPRYRDVVAEVVAFLKERIALCVRAGIRRDRSGTCSFDRARREGEIGRSPARTPGTGRP